MAVAAPVSADSPPESGVAVRIADDGEGFGVFPDFTVVETYGLFGASDFVGGEDCLHPDDSGHRRIAGAFAAAIG